MKYECTPAFNPKVFLKLYLNLINIEFFSNSKLRIKVFVTNKNYLLYTSYMKLNTDLVYNYCKSITTVYIDNNKAHIYF